MVEEALVFLDRYGRYVTATTAALTLIGVPDHELASFRVASIQRARRVELADWGVLTERGAGVGEARLIAPDGREFQVSAVVTHISSGWRITLEPLDRPAQEPGVMRMAPEVLAAWRGAERSLATEGESDGATAGDVDRLRRQYGQLTAQLVDDDAQEASDAAPTGHSMPTSMTAQPRPAAAKP